MAVAGSNATTNEVLICDPYYDVSAPAANSAVHNDAQYVSQDPYTTALFGPPNPPPPGYPPVVLELQNYLQPKGLPDPNWHAFVRGAVATSPIPVHDVAVTNLTSSKTVICRGNSGNLTVTVQNLGSFAENFNVTVYANLTAQANETAITTLNFSLTSGSNATQAFLWNTAGFAYGNYSLKAAADVVLGETNTANNNCTDGWVRLSIPGDITGGTPNLLDFVPDGKVDMKDIGVVAKYFGQNAPPAPPNCDLTGPTPGVPDGKIDMRDVGLAARHFGEHE